MADAEIRESIRASLRRLAAIAEGAELANEPLELIELRDQQLKNHFRRFHDEHLKIVAAVDEHDGARDANQVLMADTEEMYLLAHARYVRRIRQLQFAQNQERAAQQAEVERQAAVANEQRAVIDEPLVNIQVNEFDIEPLEAALVAQQLNPIDHEPPPQQPIMDDYANIAQAAPMVINQPPPAALIDNALPDQRRVNVETNQGGHQQAEAGNANSDQPENQQQNAGNFRHVPPNTAILRQRNTERAQENQFVVVVKNDQHIKLPRFEGDFAEWPEFRDSFLQLVHERDDVTAMSKYNSLVQHLSGSACRVIAGLTRSADNYPIAWQLLCDQYEHPRLFMNTLLKQVKELKPLTEGNAAGLQFVVFKFKQILRQLQGMGYNEEMNPMLMVHLTSILDRTTFFEWETRNPDRAPQPLSALLDFLHHRANCMVHAQAVSGHHRAEQYPPHPKRARATVGHVATESTANEPQQTATEATSKRCPVCNGSCKHLARCKKFIDFKPFKRQTVVRKNKLCLGCLKAGHNIDECDAEVCPHCASGRQHHELLCFARYAQLNPQPSTSQVVGLVRMEAPTIAAVTNTEPKSVRPLRRQYFPCPETNLPFTTIDQAEIERQENPMAQVVMANQASGALLATAIIRVRTVNGEYKVMRVLCDTGAQANLISERGVQLIAATREASYVTLSPVGNTDQLRTRGAVQVIVAPLIDGSKLFRAQIKALVLKKVTHSLPSAPLDIGTWPSGIIETLADPTAATPGAIDMILGAHVWSLIAEQGFFNNLENNLVGQQTKFGWLLFGGIAEPGQTIFGHVKIEHPEPIEEDLARIHSRTKVSPARERTEEEEDCERIYANEFRRLATGRYCVPIPLKADVAELGKSHLTAVRRFHQLESRFQRDPEFKQKYIEFMDDYLAKGHMRLVTKPIDITKPHYIIPHHGIQSAKKKFRTVFDGSAETSSGQSCNDVQMLGERLQQDLANILLNFRINEYAMVADIQQMYRQILIPENQQQFQLILWRKSTKEKLQTYALTTVTYGMKHAPHSAVRTLKQIAIDHKTTHPYASVVSQRDFYMDDLITGAPAAKTAVKLYHQMKDMMESAGMNLRKWASNKWEVVNEFDTADCRDNQPYQIDPENSMSVLGVEWNPLNDNLQFRFHKDRSVTATTKRMVTSEVAKIFDPTGLVAPVITRGKLLIRELWALKFGWDDELTPDITTKWTKYYETMPNLTKIRIPRWLGASKPINLQLHGFAAASPTAYAAVIYTTIIPENYAARNHSNCKLLTAKTRIAPMKTTSAVRLELCAMELLAKLMARVSNIMDIKCGELWTSSPVASIWLSKEPQEFKMYVANRMKAVKELTEQDTWCYAPPEDNPAKIAADGTDVDQLLTKSLWFDGPKWLTEREKHTPTAVPELTDEERESVRSEEKPKVIGTVTPIDWWIAERYSNFTRMASMVAIVKKCVKHWREQVAHKQNDSPTKRSEVHNNKVTYLSREDQIDGENFWIKRMQAEAYAGEITALKSPSKQIANSSNLSRLAPFMGTDGIIRVGGRLKNATLTQDEKFPIILPAKNRITRLMIERVHMSLLHGGPQMTAQEMRKHFWLIGGRNVVRQVVHSCQVCKRFRGKTADQQLADLVPERVLPTRPFNVISVDYCGPFEVKRYSGRCPSKIKCYVAVFICMWSRAVHFEVVSDLSTDGFIDAYQRFAARRGHSYKIISDNATTFVGTKRKIDQIRKHMEEGAQREYFRENSIEWKFIAPRAPWQGGSHEAAVKLLKHHLRRVMCGRSFSITEFTSLVTRIEGCVNSRPLGTISENGTDELAITPMSLTLASNPRRAIVEDDVTDRKSLASKWQAIQQAHQVFWKKWQQGYLNHLQIRNKRKFRDRNMEVGDIVLVKDDGAPPQAWPMGKIIAVHHGRDQLVRNVTVFMNGKGYTRAIQKLILLEAAEKSGPIDQAEPASTKGEAELQVADDTATDLNVRCEPAIA